MTLDERARAIVNHCQNTDGDPIPFIEYFLFVIAQLREVEREAHDHGWSVCKDCYEVNQDGEDKGEHIGFLKAREKAAGIADINSGICDGGDHTTHKVAEQIRGMEP